MKPPEHVQSYPQWCWFCDESASIQPGQKTEMRISLSSI